MEQNREQLRRAHDNFIEGYRVLARAIPGGEILQKAGAEAIFTGRPDVEFNRVFLLDMPEDPCALFAWVEEAASRHRAGYMVVAAPDAAVALGAAAAQFRLEASRPVHPMLLARLDDLDAPPPIRGLEVERVSSPALAGIFAGAVADGFGVPTGFYWSYAAPGAWDAPNVASYIGWLNGEAVATAATVISGIVAGLYQVTTAPGHRRTGLGEAMTRHALLAAAAEGAEEAALQSTVMGFRLYRRMGFEPAASYRTWYSREP